MKTDFFEFFIPARIIAGTGMVDSLGQEMENMGWSRCFIITDKVLVKLGLVDRVLNAFKGSSIEVVGIFDEVVPNTEVGLVEKGAAAAKEVNPDFLLAIGGGSNIDTAKGINIVLSTGGKLLDYEGFGLITAPLTPLVAIPTTAGTGSEVTQYAVIKDDSRHTKLSFLSPYLVPSIAVLDPEMTVGLPPELTATTGMDALTHAVEAHLSNDSNPVASGLALEAIRLIFEYLPVVTARGDDLEARHAMLVASTMAGMAFSSAMVGVVHALAHACGGLFSVPHGLANSILLPFGMEYNLCTSARELSDIARAAGIPDTGLTVEEHAVRAIQAVKDLNIKCGMTKTLKDTGITLDDLEKVAELALVDGAIFNNPNPGEMEGLMELLKKAY
ncbi:MAG: iron-containing alcohol dehydrogenase [Desulfocucumaceae bacterium]